MSASNPAPPGAIVEGVDGLRGLDGVDVLEHPRWDAGHRRWVLRCRITCASAPTPFVPRRSEWYVLIGERYPGGAIQIFPAQKGGVDATFRHQKLNTDCRESAPWRAGELCLVTGAHALGRLGGHEEPLTARQRLGWHLARAVDWLEAAATDTLAKDGDAFELPDFSTGDTPVLGFAEDTQSFQSWRAIPWGTADVYVPEWMPGRSLAVVSRYMAPDGAVVHEPAWGRAFRAPTGRHDSAVWVRFAKVPHLAPWKAPETWLELTQLAAAEGLNLDEIIERAVRLRRMDGPSYMLCGFPVPDRIGERPRELFWQALRLPPPATEASVLRGFRNTPKARRQHDRRVRMRSGWISWMRSENWHASSRSARGQLCGELTSRRVLLIGCGALGSTLAEMLVRGGLRELTLVDGQTLTVGNLVRHVLTSASVGLNKAEELATRLNRASPQADVYAITRTFEDLPEQDLNRVQATDLVIDCTGDDEVACALDAFPWLADRTFVSLSLDLHAERLLCSCNTGQRFESLRFLEQAHEELRRRHSTTAPEDLPREGLGCWHPLMPARIDDIYALAAAGVRYLESNARSPREGFAVLERANHLAAESAIR